MSRFSFEVGATYTRSRIKQMIGLDPESKGGPWDTGYAQRDGADFIFCNVGVAGRTGHDYPNRFDGNELIWHGKTNSHQDQPTILRMTAASAEVHVFWRADERTPFTYAGLGTAVGVSDDVPVQVRWRFRSPTSTITRDARRRERLPAEMLNRVKTQHVKEAVRMLLDGHTDHQFGPSTDYDLIVGADVRLPPKAVFGVAATLALGFEVLPKHFSAGTTSICFKRLKDAGYLIVPKDQALATDSPLLMQARAHPTAEEPHPEPRLTMASSSSTVVNRDNAVARAPTGHTRALAEMTDAVEQAHYFVDPDAEDGRTRALREVVQRRGQAQFRRALLHAYGGRCAVTGCDAVDALEAAHLIGYHGPLSQHVSNGVLLRADIHTLFDLELLAICPDSFTIVLADSLRQSSYAALHGQALTLPLDPLMLPSRDALAQRWRSAPDRVSAVSLSAANVE
jgi:hypothetical protein